MNTPSGFPALYRGGLPRFSRLARAGKGLILQNPEL